MTKQDHVQRIIDAVEDTTNVLFPTVLRGSISAILDEIRQEALEEAAKVCELADNDEQPGCYIARQIRELAKREAKG